LERRHYQRSSRSRRARQQTVRVRGKPPVWIKNQRVQWFDGILHVTASSCVPDLPGANRARLTMIEHVASSSST